MLLLLATRKIKKHDWQTDFPIPASPTAGNAEGI